jgi:hypothetical protein
MIQPEREIDGLSNLRLFRAFYRRAVGNGRQAGLTRIAMLGYWHGAAVVRPRGLCYRSACKTPSH